METKLNSIPKFLRLEPSPRVQDSAFPPFKIEHRYKGVYERAGFDVYRGERGDKSPSMYSPLSANQSTFPAFRNTGHDSYERSEKNDFERTDRSYQRGNRSNPSFHDRSYGSNRSIHGSNHSAHGSNHSVHSRPSVTSAHDQYIRARSHEELSRKSPVYDQAPPTAQLLPYRSQPYTELKSPRNYSGSTAVNSLNEPQVVIKQNSSVSSGSEFNFSPQNHLTKNYMGLSLPLNEEQVDNDQLSDDTVDDTTQSRTYYDTNTTSVRLSREISHSASVETDELMDSPQRQLRKFEYNGLPTPPRTGNDTGLTKASDLNAALNEFREDFKSPSAVSAEPPSIQINEGPRTSYNAPESEVDPSDQFESFRQQNQVETENLNTDYQNFLSNKLPVNDGRKSQLSMVSSIVSKESRYSEDEDAEVQKELERQLASLKTGSSDLLSQPQKSPIDETKHIIPTVNIMEPSIESESEAEPEVDPEVESESNGDSEYHFAPSPTRQSPIRPLRADTQGTQFVEPPDLSAVDSPVIETPSLREESDETPNIQPYPQQFPEEESDLTPRIPYQNETPELSPKSVESIKPLSVTNNKTREFELPDISQTPKTIYEPEQLNTEPIYPVTNDLPEVRLSKTVPAFKYPSGSGPCRSCGELISPDAKGPKKSIYSKTGELTGQWHRECFECAHEQCNIRFNKSVQCYVLDDEAYCSHHYHILNKSLCDFCQSGIEGECIENELEQKWHLHCLKCFHCQTPINTDYYLINDSIFCENDAYQIISGNRSFNDASGNHRNGLTTNDKIEKRRTRLMHIE